MKTSAHRGASRIWLSSGMVRAVTPCAAWPSLFLRQDNALCRGRVCVLVTLTASMARPQSQRRRRGPTGSAEAHGRLENLRVFLGFEEEG